jgi:hypothetical protein
MGVQMVWQTLLPVIVGGGIAVAGGLAGPLLSNWLNDQAAKRKQRTEKLAEMIAAIYENDHWLMMYRNVTVWGATTEIGPRPLPKAIGIAAIHFPQFNLILDQLELVITEYEVWMIDAAKKRIAKRIEEIGEGFGDAHISYVAKRTEVIDAMRKYAKELGEG